MEIEEKYKDTSEDEIKVEKPKPSLEVKPKYRIGQAIRVNPTRIERFRG